MKSAITIFSILGLLSCNREPHPQEIKRTRCAISIEPDEWGLAPYLVAGPDTIYDTYTSNEYAKILLCDCKGAMHFESYKDSILSTRGNYLDATDTLESDVHVVDPAGINNDTILCEKFFHPVKTGAWEYFDKGKLKLRRIYDRGVLKEVDSII